MNRRIDQKCFCVVSIFFVIFLTDSVNTSSLRRNRRPQGGDTSHPTVERSVKYSEWSDWSPCTRSCRQSRTRDCLRPDLCNDDAMRETRRCRTASCNNESNKTSSKSEGMDEELSDIIVDLLYNPWSDWGPCSRQCKQRRVRTCAWKAWCRHYDRSEERHCYPTGTKCEQYAGRNNAGNNHIRPRPTSAKPKPNHHKHKNKVSKPTTPVTEDTYKPTPKTTSNPEPSVSYNMSAECGIANHHHRIVKRVIGGEEAFPNTWPWQVALLNRFEEHYCGGTLIAPRWVLTAAHCVRKKGRRRKVIVRIGEHDFGTFEGTELTSRVAHDFVYPGYDRETIDNDIALLKLKKAVEPGPQIGFACIPEHTEEAPLDSTCYTVGWGKVRETHIFGSDVLIHARIPLVDNATCQSAFEYAITDNQMCAGTLKGGLDSCSGDSGGPLICLLKRGSVERWVAYGVTSFGEGCGDKGKFGIYTKVPNYSKWINRIIRKHS